MNNFRLIAQIERDFFLKIPEVEVIDWNIISNMACNKIFDTCNKRSLTISHAMQCQQGDH